MLVTSADLPYRKFISQCNHVQIMRQYSIAITYFILLQIVTFDYLFTCLTLQHTSRLIISTKDSKPREWQERSRLPASLLEAKLQGSSLPLRPLGRLPLPQVRLVLSNLVLTVFYSRRCEEAPPLPAWHRGPARDPPLPEVD